MCGIAGVFSKNVQESDLEQMLNVISHRGPDEGGTFIDDSLALGTARLSIIDIRHGQQPIYDDQSGTVIAFNGEIFNYPELKAELESKGQRFKTSSDTEVIQRCYLAYGDDFAKKLNGQFAIAIWDPRARKLILARDRFGICPLFYYHDKGELFFASEIKALVSNPRVPRNFNSKALDQMFTFWTPVRENTFFENIYEVPPGSMLVVSPGEIKKQIYWQWPFPQLQTKLDISFEDAAESFLENLDRSVAIRLRADVEVGSYLSGGIDSSAIVAMARKHRPGEFRTFSIGFEEESYDERRYQKMVADHYKTNHQTVLARAADIEGAFRDVIYHNEGPIFRTAPAPLFLLSRSVRSNNLKVVLSGEGADEILMGYDLFRELKIREFWSRSPNSEARPKLFGRLYAYLPQFSNPKFAELAAQSYGSTLRSSSEFYSHIPRWNNNSMNKVYFSERLKSALNGYDCLSDLESAMPSDYFAVGNLDRAQYLETQTLLRSYLLSSQADRMTMANSVEGRYPFLDHELVSFVSKLPPRYMLCGLKDKYILRKAMRKFLPDQITSRPKIAYQAPEIRAFISKDGKISPLVNEYLSEDRIKDVGLFDPKKVKMLLHKANTVDLGRLGIRDNMAFVQILSTQIFFDLFFYGAHFRGRERKITYKTRIRKKDAC